MQTLTTATTDQAMIRDTAHLATDWDPATGRAPATGWDLAMVAMVTDLYFRQLAPSAVPAVGVSIVCRLSFFRLFNVLYK